MREPYLLRTALTERLNEKIGGRDINQSTRERNYGLGEKEPCQRTLCEAQAYGKHLLSQRTDEHECANVHRALLYMLPAIQRHVGLFLFCNFFLADQEKSLSGCKFLFMRFRQTLEMMV